MQGTIAESIPQHEIRLMHTVDMVQAMVQESPTGLSIDEIAQKVIQNYSIPASAVSWMLTRTNVNAIVAYLCNEKKLKLTTHNALLRAERP
jgi:hypothetical protein